MVELNAISPCAGLLPISAGGLRLTEIDPGRITSVTPYNGRHKAAGTALKSGAGMAFPAPNRATGRQGARAVWVGQGQALVLGPEVAATVLATVAAHAALSDQSDAWASLRLEGGAAEAVLARLVPVDLRVATFKRGHSVRTQLGHMAVSITRTGAAAFDLLVMRSFA
ncbi:MAG: sarcosine oxidase subunit gamma, partial [Halocynthiibacter sp.]